MELVEKMAHSGRRLSRGVRRPSRTIRAGAHPPVAMEGTQDEAPVLVALFPREESAAIVAALAPDAAECHADRTELVRRLTEGSARVLIVPASGADGLPALPLVTQLRLLVPGLMVIVLASEQSTGRDLAALRLSSVRIASEVEQVLDVLQQIGAHRPMRPATAHRLRSALDRLADAELRELLWEVARDPGSFTSGRALAAHAGIRYRSLCRHALERGWPAPHGILRVARLLRYACEDEAPWRARVSGFASRRALRMAVEQQLGEDVGEGGVRVEEVMGTIVRGVGS